VCSSDLKNFPFGYYRTEIFSAAINGFSLLIISGYIFYQSYLRFLSPQPVKNTEMLIIAVIGFLANLYVVMKTHGHDKHNLNIRGAYLHVLSDALSSVGVIVAGVLIGITGNYIFDPMISVAIASFILISAVRLIRESVYILMETTPKHIDLEKLQDDIEKINGVDEVHDLHVWCITSDVCALNAHVLIKTKNIKSMNKIVSNINKMLEKKYGITHTVIQPECEKCVKG
jgi:cobalt-zinc-cadmium efflux system protein